MSKKAADLTLEEKIDRLESKLEEYVSFRKSFWVGMIRGLGSAIGTTVIFAVLVVVLDRALQNIGSIPVLDPVIDYILENILGSVN